MDSLSRSISQKLLQIKAIKLNRQKPFTWASGLRSPIYCDNRIALSYPEVRNEIKKAFIEVSGEFGEFDVVAGVATAGIPHGVLLADALGLPFIYVRSENKSHGRQNKIEGELLPGKRVLIVEDLISTGGSCLRVADEIKENGCKVAGILSIFTYDLESATVNFVNAQCRNISLTNYQTLIKEAVAGGFINEDDYQALVDWSQDPEAWSNNFLEQTSADQ